MKNSPSPQTQLGAPLIAALLLAACSASAPATGTDAGPSGSTDIVSDLGVPTDAAADVPGTACTSDRTCSALGAVCDRDRGVCVECRTRADCPGASTACLAQRCVPVTACTSSRQCPGQVCNTTLGYCVDCNANGDCASDQLCRDNSCVARPRACTSSRQCSDLGLVCDPTMSLCVECVGDNDCTAGTQFCAAGGRCLARVCAPGSSRCATGDITLREVCDTRGSGYTTSTCPAATNAAGACTGGTCGLACNSGYGNCDGNALNGCETGLSANDLNCGACGQACAAGLRCVAGACTMAFDGGETVVDTGSTTPTDTGSVTGSMTMDRACVPSGAENTAASCMDNSDNDCNGFTDCRDFSCSRNNPAVTFCPDAGTSTPRDGSTLDIGPCTVTGMENTAAACTDGLDNDCDGFRDCADFDCPRATCPRDGGTATDASRCDSGGSRENTNAECNDGIDNDCDGLTDCTDFSCRTCAITVCVADGGITTRDGGVCMCQGTENSNTACSDRFDNDCDGFVDCGDFDCSMSDGGVSVCGDAAVPRD